MHLRVAAGVCALSTGLLIASPAAAIAAAETGSGGTTAPTEKKAPAKDPVGSIVRGLNKALQDTTKNAFDGVAGTLNSLAKPGGVSPPSTKPPWVIFGGTPTVYGSSGPLSAVPDDAVPGDAVPGDAVPVDAVLMDEPAVSEGAGLSASVPGDLAPTIKVATKPTVPAATVPNPTQVANNVANNVIVPLSNVIAAVAVSVAAAPALVVSLPTSATPAFDVITSLQTLLTSVVDASTPLAQLPADLTGLASLLGVPAEVPATPPGTGAVRLGPSAVTDAPMPVPAPGTTALLPALPSIAPMPPLGVLAGPAVPLDATTAGASRGITTTSGSIAARPAADSSVLSVIENVIGAVVATVSLAALFAVALPGILGLLGTCAAGIRIGYRQAKAGSELPATAIARFVGSGPVGIVRSGSQISLRPRLVRTPARQARTPRAEARSSSLQLLDRAV